MRQIYVNLANLVIVTLMAVVMIVQTGRFQTASAEERASERGRVVPWERPGDYRPELPDFTPSAPETPLILPQVPGSRPGGGEASTIQTVFVRKFNFQGNHAISTKELDAIALPYENRGISFEQLQDLRYRITAHYIEKGYINSGAVIPDQDIVEGVIVFQIIEGKLTDIRIDGNQRLRPGYIRGRIDPGPENPLNVHALQEKFQLLQQNPLIDHIKGEIKPGVNLGEAVLDVAVKEARPFHGGIQSNNHRSPSSGSEILEAYLIHDNLTTFGDSLEISYGLAAGVDDAGAIYRLPLNASDTILGLRYSRISSSVVEAPFDKLDIESLSDTFTVSITHPFVKTAAQEFSVTLSGDKRHNETTLLDKPFSFSEGVTDGEYDEAIIRLEQNWVRRSRVTVMAVRSLFSWGVDALDATINRTGPDGKFYTWIGQFQWGRRLEQFHDSQVIFRTDTQIAANALLPMERFAIGGANTVRGYRENELLRDSGVIGSVEMRVPVCRLPLGGITKTAEEGFLQIAPFGDIGHGWNKEAPQGELNTLASLGLGLRYDPSREIHTEIYWGVPLRDPEDEDHHDLQDYGIHFLMNWRAF